VSTRFPGVTDSRLMSTESRQIQEQPNAAGRRSPVQQMAAVMKENGAEREPVMNTRYAWSGLLLAAVMAGSFACAAAPRERPVKMGPVDTGSGTLTSARTFLNGRWALESFEVRLPDQPPIVLKGAGTLLYDDMGNLTMNIRADEKSSDILRAAGVDIRDGAIITEGHAAIDLQNHTLTYMVDGQAPLIKGPLGTDRPRHWVVEGDVLILTTKDQAGQPTSIGRWRKTQ